MNKRGKLAARLIVSLTELSTLTKGIRQQVKEAIQQSLRQGADPAAKESLSVNSTVYAIKEALKGEFNYDGLISPTLAAMFLDDGVRTITSTEESARLSFATTEGTYLPGSNQRVCFGSRYADEKIKYDKDKCSRNPQPISKD